MDNKPIKHNGTWECADCHMYNWPPAQECRMCGSTESYKPQSPDAKRKGKHKK